MPISAPTTDRATDRGNPAEAGFTLIEMLVAMLLLSLVGLTLARFQTFQLAGTATLASISAARLEADNIAIDLLLARGAPVETTSFTTMNAGRQWHAIVQPGPSPDPLNMPELVRIDISISESEGAPPIAKRTLIRPQGELPRTGNP